MVIKSAAFLKSSKDFSQFPPPNKIEIAVIGRSNVGKSSLINMITQRRNLAKTSSTPGKTQLINHFDINDTWYLVDLPGYGWAKASKADKAAWKSLVDAYLLKRDNLILTMVLIDIRHPPLPIDLDFLKWLGNNSLPFALCFTKSDKVPANKLQPAIQRYKEKLLTTWEWLPPIFISSAKEKTGRDEILTYFEEVLNKVNSASKIS